MTDMDPVRAAWEQNARWWSDRTGEGNDFHLSLVAPAVEEMLALVPGEEVLEVACGNGAFARRMAQLGSRVTAFDFSSAFIACANEKSCDPPETVEYRVLDATRSDELATLGEGRFDAAVSNMALMDMADINPLAEAMPKLLRPGGRFVMVTAHPCFNQEAARRSLEQEPRDGGIAVVPSVRVTRYLTPFSSPGIGIRGQPVPHIYFHRPLQDLLGPFLRQGLVLTALKEKAFEDASRAATPLSWDRFPECPPLLVVRFDRNRTQDSV
mgnify:CR=1 FL=1